MVVVSGCYSSADWNVGLVGGQTISAAETTSPGSIPTGAAVDGGGTIVPSSCCVMGAMGIIASRSKRSVLNNRDLCRIVSSYIPERIDRV